MIRCSPDRCMTPQTRLVCPSNLQYGLIARISSVTAAGKDIIFCDCCNTTFSAVVCYYPRHHSPRNLLVEIRCWRHAVNEGQRAIENCVKCERYEMRVEWIEVWTLFAVRYTCLILVYFIAFNCSAQSLFGSHLGAYSLVRQPSPASHVAWTCYRTESTNFMRLETSGRFVSGRTSPKKVRNRVASQFS
jgi:hypothetical protein